MRLGIPLLHVFCCKSLQGICKFLLVMKRKVIGGGENVGKYLLLLPSMMAQDNKRVVMENKKLEKKNEERKEKYDMKSIEG